VAGPTRLHLRFALATAAVIAAAGGAVLWYVRHEYVATAEHGVTTHATYVAQNVLGDELVPSDLTRQATGERLRRLDALFASRVLVDGALRVKLYRRSDGLVVYSNEHALIGSGSDDLDEFPEILAGHVHRDITHLNHEGGAGANVKALEVYVPIRLRGASKPGAVFELYESYAPVATAVHQFMVPVALILIGMLVALWTGLFPLIQRMVRVLERSRTLHHSTARALEETEEQLRHAQKMDAIGRLAGGVAHDFNNLLLAINGYSELLEDVVDEGRARRYVAEIRSAGARAAELTQQLLAFSRRQVLQTTLIDLNDTVREFDGMLRRVIGEGVRIVLDLEPRLRPVSADPGPIGQVLVNLAVNARDAMGGSGTLRIATRSDGGDVVLEVADNGVGMDEEIRARIFEPFFTTKPVGQGTGLGLSTVYGIVAQSGGSISVRSAPGLGATFRIRLPAADEALAPGSVEIPAEPNRGRERILVVDDEKVVRKLLVQMLGELGYDVSAAGSAREAQRLSGPWDLLVTDVVMPELNGVELARGLDARQVLYISGYDQEALVQTDDAFLQKPFGRDDLARAVRTLLDRTPERVAAA
jgi:signal transduction histidine kinase